MGAYIAVDIGGTRLRVAVYPEEGIEPIAQERVATRGSGSPIDRLIDLIAKLWPTGERVLGIGATAPGPLDPKTGIVFKAPNIPGWTNFPLQSILAERFNVPVYIGNDANMAAAGEWRYGAGVGHHNLVYFTVSTGIGGGVILDDHLLLGERGLATELGHITVDPNGPLCGCGHRGHLEAFSSGTAISRYVAEQLALGVESSLRSKTVPTAKDIAAAAQAGDGLAIEAFNRAGTYLGRAIGDFLHVFNPSIVILGGGVSSAGPLLFEPLRSQLLVDELSPKYLDDLIITTAMLGDDAGLLGTLAMARIQNLERQLIPDD